MPRLAHADRPSEWQRGSMAQGAPAEAAQLLSLAETPGSAPGLAPAALAAFDAALVSRATPVAMRRVLMDGRTRALRLCCATATALVDGGASGSEELPGTVPASSILDVRVQLVGRPNTKGWLVVLQKSPAAPLPSGLEWVDVDRHNLHGRSWDTNVTNSDRGRELLRVHVRTAGDQWRIGHGTCHCGVFCFVLTDVVCGASDRRYLAARHCDTAGARSSFRRNPGRDSGG
eukprot:COSAG05_NODE_1850_length_3964_cov_1.841656_4_plen_231_part_00